MMTGMTDRDGWDDGSDGGDEGDGGLKIGEGRGGGGEGEDVTMAGQTKKRTNKER